DRVEALAELEQQGRCSSLLGTLNRNSARFILRARDQLVRLLRQEMRQSGWSMGPSHQPVAEEEALGRSLLAAFPDRVARRREAGSRRGVMVGGRGVRLASSSGVLSPELFVCVVVDASQTESLVWQASAVQRDWLPAGQL